MLSAPIKSNSIDTDSLLYDPFTKRVYVNNGDGMNLTVVDAATAKVVGTMLLNANPEAAADGKGSIFQDYEDKGQVIEYDGKALMIKNKWPTPRMRVTHRLLWRWTRRIVAFTSLPLRQRLRCSWRDDRHERG